MVESIISQRDAFVDKTIFINTDNRLSSEAPQFKKLFSNPFKRWQIWWFTKKPVDRSEKISVKDYCLLHVIDRVKKEWKDKIENSLHNLSVGELRAVSKNLHALQDKAERHNKQSGLIFLATILGKETQCEDFKKEIAAVDKALVSKEIQNALTNGNKLIAYFQDESRAQTPELFRLQGGSEDVIDLQDDLDKDPGFSLKDEDVHDVANVLKRYVRALTPFEKNQREFLAVNALSEESKKIEALKKLLGKLGGDERKFVKNLVEMLAFVDRNQNGDKAMKAANLSIVFGPNMVKADSFEESGQATEVLQFMIEHHGQIF